LGYALFYQSNITTSIKLFKVTELLRRYFSGGEPFETLSKIRPAQYLNSRPQSTRINYSLIKTKFHEWTNSHILKANLRWSPTWAKFWQLFASLSVVLAQLNLTNSQLSTWMKFGF